MTRRPEIALVFFVALACGVAGCGQQSHDGNEARALLERLTAIDLRASEGERAVRIAGLRSLPLAQPELRALRDRCVLAYGGLLAAERMQEDVRRRLDHPSDAGFPPAELAALRASLAEATAQLGGARAALPECLDAARELSRATR